MSREEFDTDEQYRVQLFKELVEIAGELGWTIAMPEPGLSEEVAGLIMGEPDYVDDILDRLEEDEGIEC